MSQQHLDSAIAAAKAAGEVILPYFRTALQIETKADQSPVTAADRAGEQVIVEMLRQHFPDYGVLGEEFGAQPGNVDARWIIDPIDGTQNFIRGIPFFGTLIGLEHAGESTPGGGRSAARGGDARPGSRQAGCAEKGGPAQNSPGPYVDWIYSPSPCRQRDDPHPPH